MKFKQITASILLLAVFLNLLLLPVQAQVGDPIEITFGQPNIWSLEQAHYLLSQMRERSMRIRADELKDLDPNSAEASRINLIRQLFGLTGEFKQNPSFPEPTNTPSPTPTPIPSPPAFPGAIAEPSPLAGTILSTLIDKDFLKKLNSDSKLNATTRLDNHVQLQYEIIAKQLTLLRDEVGPDERLVFLELPQTIYASAHDTKGKVVQTYWEITGYSEYDRVADVNATIKQLQDNQTVLNKSLLDLKTTMGGSKFSAYKTQIDTTANAKKAFQDAQKNCEDNQTTRESCIQGAKSLETAYQTQEKALTKYAADNKIIAAEYDALKEDHDEVERLAEEIKKELANLNADISYKRAVNEARDTLERIRQQGSLPNNIIIQRTIDKGNVTSSEFVEKNTKVQNLENVINRKVRAVDIIPRQSSLNVNDIQETVKSSILGGAFSFLFGLGLRTNFQRQRDTFEQYLHQDIYASGFGKGENIFGWTFGPIPGTKRIASGVRTTYAVVVVPRKAESVVVNARGCYYSRKNFQPRNVMTNPPDTYNSNGWADDDDRECSLRKQQFILPIPNGGDARGFWLTAMDYSPVKKGNQRLVASINGRNFTQQVGVLIDGIPLQQVVELTRKLPSRDLLDDFCRSGICGAYEVIDSDEITIAFQMPESYTGTPEITVIGPGRSVSVNRLKLSKIQVGNKPFFNVRLTDDGIPQMFGSKPKEALAINELTVLREVPGATPAANTITALLTGSKFAQNYDEVLVNGLTPSNVNFLSSENYNLTFPLPNSDSYTIMVRRCKDKDGKLKALNNCDTGDVVKDSYEVAVKSFPIATAQFAITNVTALSYDEEQKVIFIRVEGIGLSRAVLSKVNDNTTLPAGSTQVPVSSRELLIKVTNPDPVVKITLANPNGKEISAVVARPVDERLLRQEQPE